MPVSSMDVGYRSKTTGVVWATFIGGGKEGVQAQIGFRWAAKKGLRKANNMEISVVGGESFGINVKVARIIHMVGSKLAKSGAYSLPGGTSLSLQAPDFGFHPTIL